MTSASTCHATGRGGPRPKVALALPFVVAADERRDLDEMTHASDDEAGYADSYEDVSMFTLSSDREATLLDTQTECTFMWTTSTGDPVGVIMNFVYHDGAFWLTCTRRRKRVPAIETRPRVAVAISSRGTDIGISQAVTYKGTATVLDDRGVPAAFVAAVDAATNRSRELG